MTAAADPARSVVMGVVSEALRASGARGLLLHRGGTPEHELFAGWAADAGIVVQAAEGAGPDHPGPADPALPELLPTDPANKLVLLLEGPRSGALLLPLGDLWPDEVSARAGRATDPAGFKASSSEITALVEALRAALEAGHGLGTLQDRLPRETATRVVAALLRTAPRFRPPLVPKLTTWTPGIDPGL